MLCARSVAVLLISAQNIKVAPLCNLAFQICLVHIVGTQHPSLSVCQVCSEAVSAARAVASANTAVFFNQVRFNDGL